MRLSINHGLLNGRDSVLKPTNRARCCSFAVIRHKSQLVARCDDIIHPSTLSATPSISPQPRRGLCRARVCPA